MTMYGSTHPLDVDLADLVDGLVDGARLEQLEAHLAVCLLCRIKLRRLRGAVSDRQHLPSETREAGGASAVQGHPEPLAFFVPEHLPAGDTAGDLSPGDVWSAGGDERLVLLVIGLFDDRALVAPLTFDVEAADDETVVIDAERSPFPLPVAVYPDLATEVPASALLSKLGALATPSEIKDLLDGSLVGTWRGAPIVGPTDPRLELRQLLIDRVGSIEEIHPDPNTSADAPPPGPDQVASALARDLRDWRGPVCKVRRLDSWGDLGLAYARGWVPIATVDEVGVLLVVFDTPSGLSDDLDFDAALSVLTRFNVSAVVVLATALSEMADVFDAPALNYGIDVPSGELKPPRPLLSELAPFDAISKFLEQSTTLIATAWPLRGAVPRVDVAGVLAESAASALVEVARQGQRAKIAPKVRGYSAVESIADAFAEVLSRALTGHSVIDGLFRISAMDDQ